jgi:orotate phosphoribosyltransferase
MVASHTYGFDVAAEAFREAGVELLTLTDYEHVIAEASETGYVSAADLELLRQWRQNPAEWGK